MCGYFLSSAKFLFAYSLYGGNEVGKRVACDFYVKAEDLWTDFHRTQYEIIVSQKVMNF
jgi:hypothetical protein